MTICRAKMDKGIQQRSLRGAQGFTLLEMVFVLGLIAMMVTWITVSTTTVDTEQQLREAAGSIESLIKRGRSIAVMQQRPYQIKISETGVRMSPQYVVEHFGDVDGTFDDEQESGREDFEDIIVNEEFDPEVTYEIRRWRSDVWQEIEGDTEVTLILDAMGLVEPISIRCSKGESWILQELHPLTGGVRDEEMSVEDE